MNSNKHIRKNGESYFKQRLTQLLTHRHNEKGPLSSRLLSFFNDFGKRLQEDRRVLGAVDDVLALYDEVGDLARRVKERSREILDGGIGLGAIVFVQHLLRT